MVVMCTDRVIVIEWYWNCKHSAHEEQSNSKKAHVIG